MATTPTTPQDPNNVEVKKGFVFNETGNIMMATTDLQNQEIDDSVKQDFQEVSVFFAAMTKALEKAANENMKGVDKDGNSFNYSLYDYEAMKKIIDNSGCFIQVNEEDVNFASESFGVTFSKELLEAVLGLATGTGELAFAQAMVNSVGKAGFAINESEQHSEKKVSNIIFVCEYLLGMPVISAIVLTADCTQEAFNMKIGPCVSVKEQHTSLVVHKDTYMFVTPSFIKKWSGDILDGMNNPEFEQLTQKFDTFLQAGEPATPTTPKKS
tara:strand:+ start:1094 stop:1900 length:807 start_codon:yes stop_codon:yes gene_type:complete